MKSIKVYLIVVTLMLAAALAFGVYIWVKLQTLQSAAQSTPSSQTATESTETTAESGASGGEPITVTKDQLTETQQSTLETLGFESDSITITPEMIACAEIALGRERLDEIIGGATPGPLESMRLLGCVK